MKLFSTGCKLYGVFVRSVSPYSSIINFGGVQHIKIMPFYAVAKGVVPGIYTEWSECQKQTVGFRGPQFKKFNTKEEAQAFIDQRIGNVVDKRKSEPAAPAPAAAAAAGVVKEKKKSEDSAHVAKESAAKEGAAAAADSSTNGAAKGKKRERSPDGEDEDANSGIKKRVLERDVPDRKHFEVDDSGSVVVYTDGCCQFNGRHGAKAGVGVYFGPDNPLNLSEPVRGRATNNTAEIQAITYALELIKRAGFSKAIINTDSQFVINCMTSWLSGWKKRGWKKSDGSPVINKEDLVHLDSASDGLMVKYNHVKGHSGIEGNEMADKLANAGSKSYDATIAD